MNTAEIRKPVILIADSDKEYLKACQMALLAKNITNVSFASTAEEVVNIFSEKIRNGALVVIGQNNESAFKAQSIIEIMQLLEKSNRFKIHLIANGGSGIHNQYLLDAGCTRAVSKKSELVPFLMNFGESKGERENRALEFR